jgi:hypothetical protein
MCNKLSKTEKKETLKGLEGWFKRSATLHYGIPDDNNNLKTFNTFLVLKIRAVDPDGHFALFSGLQMKTSEVTSDLTSTGATTATKDLKRVVAKIKNNGRITMKVISLDDKNQWDFYGNSNTLIGSITEFGLKSSEKAFSGGFAGFGKLYKLKSSPEQFKDIDVDVEYAQQYNEIYNDNVNT